MKKEIVKPDCDSFVAIIGTGFVADLYMRSLETYPKIGVIKAFDNDKTRLALFCKYWNVQPALDLNEVLELSGETQLKPILVLNLTNPESHFSVSKSCLEAGLHVYSEKPLATKMEDAYVLHEIAKQKKLVLTSAPCSYLSEVAQTLWRAVREQIIGRPVLVYAELDDDYVSHAPYKKWLSESGAPWPYRDEFSVGCTLEHAGYYLTWLMMMFGSVIKVVAASAQLIKHDLPELQNTAPDFSTAILFFECGLVARLTCGIIAPHNHSLRIIGEQGILEVEECWNNSAKVRVRRRHVIRRRLVNSPFASRYQIGKNTHPKVKRRGAAEMNFALGPAEVIASIKDGRDFDYLSDFSLHLNEVTLAIQNSHDEQGVLVMRTRCPKIQPMPWAE